MQKRLLSKSSEDEAVVSGAGAGGGGKYCTAEGAKMLRAKKKKQKHLSLKFTVHASALTKPNLLGFLSDRAG